MAMYLNNRAVEELTNGRFSDAYAWAREAIRKTRNWRAPT